MCCMLCYNYSTNLKNTLKGLVGVLNLTHISIKLCLLFKYNRKFRLLLTKMKEDYNGDVYTSEDEIKAFLDYNIFAKRLIKILLIFGNLTSIVYYLKPLLIRYLTIRKSFFNYY